MCVCVCVCVCGYSCFIRGHINIRRVFNAKIIVVE